MSAIKRFFSSHKTSSNSKINNHHSQHEIQTSQIKSSSIEKVTVINGTIDQEEIKENTSPSIESLSSPDIVPSPSSLEMVTTINNEEKKTTYVCTDQYNFKFLFFFRTFLNGTWIYFLIENLQAGQLKILKLVIYLDVVDLVMFIVVEKNKHVLLLHLK